MNLIKTCRVCNGKGNLKVKRHGFRREYSIKCHDCKAETIRYRTPQKAVQEWNDGWIFGGSHYAL